MTIQNPTLTLFAIAIGLACVSAAMYLYHGLPALVGSVGISFFVLAALLANIRRA